MRRVLWGLGLLGLVGVTPTPASSPALAASTAAMTSEAATRLAREVTPRVETLRGARFVRPVAVELVDDAVARTHFQARMTKFWPEEQIRADQQAYENLGLLPAGADLMKTLLDLMEEQAGGYYDPERDTFFVLDDMPSATAPVFVAHELTHALDDQRFQLDVMIDRAKDDDDGAAAISAVAEGSATVVMSLFTAQEIQAGRLDVKAFSELQASEAGRAEKLRAAPAILQRSLLGPYMLGQAFLLHGQADRLASFSPAEADRCFKDPPLSTEQIIHPEKYWEPATRDLPQPVRLADLARTLGPGWKQAGSGTLGELLLAVLTGLGGVELGSVGALAPATWTTRAASGWGGDAFHHYTNGSRSLTLVASVWDTKHDAEEFEAVVRRAPRRNVQRRERWVVIAAGDTEALRESAVEAVLRQIAR